MGLTRANTRLSSRQTVALASYEVRGNDFDGLVTYYRISFVTGVICGEAEAFTATRADKKQSPVTGATGLLLHLHCLSGRCHCYKLMFLLDACGRGTDNLHRAICVEGHRFRDATHEQAVDSMTSVRPNDD